MPTTGTIAHLRWPQGPHIRVDHALFEGLKITPNFDSLLAKLIVWGPTRAQAIERLQAALANTYIEGITTNLSFHRHFLHTQDYKALAFHTTTLSSLALPDANDLPEKERYRFLVAASVIERELAQHGDDPLTPNSPWHRLNSWRHQGERESSSQWYLPSVQVTAQAQTDGLYQVNLRQTLAAGEQSSPSTNTLTACIVRRSIGNTLTARSQSVHTIRLQAEVAHKAQMITVFFACDDTETQRGETQREKVSFHYHDAGDSLTLQSQHHRLTLTRWHSGLFASEQDAQTPGALSATVPGVVKQIHVQPGDTVTAGTVLIIVESMKIEQEITATTNGRVAEVFIAAGDRVESQQALLKIESTPADKHSDSSENQTTPNTESQR